MQRGAGTLTHDCLAYSFTELGSLGCAQHAAWAEGDYGGTAGGVVVLVVVVKQPRCLSAGRARRRTEGFRWEDGYVAMAVRSATVLFVRNIGDGRNERRREDSEAKRGFEGVVQVLRTGGSGPGYRSVVVLAMSG